MQENLEPARLFGDGGEPDANYASSKNIYGLT